MWTRTERCSKLAYRSKSAALGVRGHKMNKGSRMRTYFCKRCGYWHLTTHVGKEGK